MNKNNLPKISIVTPSFNQAQFLEDTIISVLSQNYPNLEYIIVDGGSTDGSIDIVKKYACKLAWWVSEPDKGRGDAINKGFKRSRGDIMAWLGCGDMYFPWTLSVVGEIFKTLPMVEWLTSGIYITWNSKGYPISSGFRYGFSRRAFAKGLYLPMVGTLQQESTFWRRSLWMRAGGFVDEHLWVIPDFELWARFFKHAKVYTASVPLGGIRAHPGQDKSLRIGFSIGNRILRKHYGKIAGKFLFFDIILALIKKYSACVVKYNFRAGKWQAREAKFGVFEGFLH